jgi:Calcineurin-like phosphoesterase
MHSFGGRSVRLLAALALTLPLAVAGPAPTPAAAADMLATTGYWMATADGGVYSFGQAAHLGSMAGTRLVQPIVAVAATPSGNGYWLASADGGLFNYGDAPFHGAMGGRPLNQPIVGMATAPNGGYWLTARDGGLFAFGGAGFTGSMGGKPLNAPIVGVAAANNSAYWLVASDGGMFAFGGAPFKGSMGGKPLNQPIVGMAATPDRGGYWLVARDGGIFAFGNAAFKGSMGGTPLNQPIVGMTASPTGQGYSLVAADGGIFSFGDAAYFGSTGGQALRSPVVGMAAQITMRPPPANVLLAAGDVAGCDSTGDSQTAALLDSRPGTVLPLGDLAYESGTLAEFQNCYDPTWGRHRGRSRPVPGNHEYVSGAAGYFDYFGPAAGERGKGYYSYDTGGWHIVALNSEDCVDSNGCSAQASWLAADLSAHKVACTVAYWHKPRYSSNRDEPLMAPLWNAAAAGGVDVVLAGHDHVYERLAPIDDMRTFIVGTGGRSHHAMRPTARAESQVRNDNTFGVLSLTLRAGAYDWQFVPAAGASFTDTGTDTCRNA